MISWTEELVTYMFVWFAYFGASYAARLAAHNRLTFQFKLMPRKLALALETLSSGVVNPDSCREATPVRAFDVYQHRTFRAPEKMGGRIDVFSTPSLDVNPMALYSASQRARYEGQLRDCFRNRAMAQFQGVEPPLQ